MLARANVRAFYFGSAAVFARSHDIRQDCRWIADFAILQLLDSKKKRGSDCGLQGLHNKKGEGGGERGGVRL